MRNPSTPVVASIEPSGLNATSVMSPPWPGNERRLRPVSTSRMSTTPEPSDPSVAKTLSVGLQSRRPPTPGTDRTIREATTARCSASSASGGTAPPSDRASSTAWTASRMLRSGSISRLASAAAASSLAVASEASRDARSLWFAATIVSDPATSAATAKTATRPRSRRTDRRSTCASCSRRRSSSLLTRSRSSTLAFRYARSGRPIARRRRSAPRLDLVQPCTTDQEARVPLGGAPFRGRPREPPFLPEVLPRFVDPRSRAAPTRRSKASCAISTVGSRVAGSRSKVSRRWRPKVSSTPSIAAGSTSSASSSLLDTRRRVSCRPSPSVTSRRNTCLIARRPLDRHPRLDGRRAPTAPRPRRRSPGRPPASSRRRGVRSNSSVSAYCSSGSAPGWCATSAIISATSPGSSRTSGRSAGSGSPARARRA